jgi:hypothetical protein
MGIYTYGKGFAKMTDIAVYDEKTLFPSILAVDFDGTLVTNEFPRIGEVNPEVWNAVKAYQDKGWKIILWTCRTDLMLQEAVEFCCERGLTFDAVNDNLKEVKEFYKGNTRKVFANLYIDDRNASLLIKGAEALPEFVSVDLIKHQEETNGA